ALGRSGLVRGGPPVRARRRCGAHPADSRNRSDRREVFLGARKRHAQSSACGAKARSVFQLLDAQGSLPESDRRRHCRRAGADRSVARSRPHRAVVKHRRGCAGGVILVTPSAGACPGLHRRRGSKSTRLEAGLLAMAGKISRGGDHPLTRRFRGHPPFPGAAMSRLVTCFLCLFALAATVRGQTAVELRVPVEGQPLSANVTRVLQALQFLGTPLSSDTSKEIEAAAQAGDADRLQDLLDPHVLLAVTINPESRVKVQRGLAEARLQQAGFTPVLVKIINHSTLTREVRAVSPQSGQVYAGMTQLSAERMQRTHLRETLDKSAAAGRFLELEMYSRPPMTPNLSGLAAEYAIALIYSSESGRREATIGFEVGQGNQDLGFRG